MTSLLHTVRLLAVTAGIPTPLLSAVEHRARRAERAFTHVTGYAVLGAGVAVLAQRVVDGAVRYYQVGVLERRCV